MIFPLKKEWYEKIKSGEKPIEYRVVKPYWTKRIANNFCRDLFELETKETVFRIISTIGFAVTFSPNPKYSVKLRYGYTKNYLKAQVWKIEVVVGKDTDLHIDKPVYAIHLADVREE